MKYYRSEIKLKNNIYKSNFQFVFYVLLSMVYIYIINNYLIFFRGKDKLWIQDTLKHNSPYTSICWITALVIFTCSFLLVIISLVYSELWYLFVDGLFIFMLLIVNLGTVLWDNKLRHEEMFTKLDYVMKKLNCK